MRVYGDDDYPLGTDDQYTEGMNGEICMPWVRKFPLSYLLVHPHFSRIRYGIGVDQAGYTPADLKNPGIPVGDRPFAATLFLKTFLIATDAANKQRFTTTLSTGLIGEAAQGDNLQQGAHIILNDVVPEGWKYQVHNDAVLNYQANYQKELVHLANNLSLGAEALARGGTLSDEAGLALNLLIGYFESPYSDSTMPRKKFRFYIYDHPEGDVVGYDAPLEGGVFDHDSPYTIAAKDLSHFTFQNRTGIVISYGRFTFEYNECLMTRQFSYGPSHGWGGAGIAMILD